MMPAHSRVDRNRNDSPLWYTMAPHSPRKFLFAGQRDAVAKLSTPRSPAFFSLTQPLAALLYSCPSPLILVALSLARAPQNLLAQPLSRLACPSLAQSLSPSRPVSRPRLAFTFIHCSLLRVAMCRKIHFKKHQIRVSRRCPPSFGETVDYLARFHVDFKEIGKCVSLPIPLILLF